ncbi:sigma factor-like helix-turn-helix DNA-binding protein [Streptosporangium canum]|uniref:sigma factor-like helix-turn-helix DNA-binding protein n=1 Tax=Streptosporangium canum TaxID=324952 RepID=UPI003424E719
MSSTVFEGGGGCRKEVLRMAYCDDMTQAEIALALESPLGTVKSRTARAQRGIADLLRHVAEPA